MSDTYIHHRKRRIFGAFRNRIRASQDFGETTRDLRELPDWALRDIGLLPKALHLPKILPGTLF